MNRLRKYTDDCFSRLKKHVREYAKDESAETLHKIRVDIKKIKVVLLLINANVKGFHAHRKYIPFRNIFRATQKIKEPDWLGAMLLRHGIDIEHLHIPDEEKQAARSQRFIKEIPDFIRTIVKQKKKLNKHVRKVSKAQIKKYLKERNEALQLHFRGRWNEKSLHKARKVTKEMLYVGLILKKRNNSGDFFDKLQDLIGQWHDRQALLPILIRHKSPEIQRLKVESRKSIARIRKFVSDYYRKKSDQPLLRPITKESNFP